MFKEETRTFFLKKDIIELKKKEKGGYDLYRIKNGGILTRRDLDRIFHSTRTVDVLSQSRRGNRTTRSNTHRLFRHIHV